MMRFMLFEEFKKKKRRKTETESFEPPEYLVEPAKNDKGFFMFKKAYDKRRRKFSTGYFS